MAQKKTTKKKTKKTTATTSRRSSSRKTSSKNTSKKKTTVKVSGQVSVAKTDPPAHSVRKSKAPRISRSGGESLHQIQAENKLRKEDSETVSWLAEQQSVLAQDAGKLDKVSTDDILKEFDKTLTLGLFDQDSLEAAATHSAIERLERAYGEAEADLLKSRRKVLVLKKLVHRAHDLLEQQALPAAAE